MGVYQYRFGDRDCQIRIGQRGNVIDCTAHIVRVGEPLDDPHEAMPVLPNEDALLSGMIRFLREQFGPEPQA